MVKQARGISGLLSELISHNCPEQRELLPEWKEAVGVYVRRAKSVELVAAALIKFMALSAMNEKGASKPFFNDLPNNLIFKSFTHIANCAGRFEQENSPESVEMFPAFELLRVYDREPPETTWAARWQAACVAAGDDRANKVFKKTGRMIALKSSEVWQQLGDGAGGYDDIYGNPFPPFAFNSGFDVNTIDRFECEKLGLL